MLNYDAMSTVMFELGFITENPLERTLVLDIWNHLKGDDFEGVSSHNLKIYLSAILNFNFPFMKAEQENEDEEQHKKRINPKEIGEFNGQKYVLTDGEISWI
jgi:hypothetical protein